MALKTPILLFSRELHSQAVYTDSFYHSQTNHNNAMFGLFVVLGGGYSTRQGSEDLSEAAMSVTAAAKLGISWRDLIAFCLEVLHFNILFFSDTCILITLIIFLCIIAKICIIYLGCGFNSGFPQCGKKSLGNISMLHFGERQSSALCNVGAIWQPEHRYFLSVLLTTEKEYLEHLTPGVFTEAWKQLELPKAIATVFSFWQLINYHKFLQANAQISSGCTCKYIIIPVSAQLILYRIKQKV